MTEQTEVVNIELSRPPRKPEWLKARAPLLPELRQLQELARGLGLHTVCESARCPNIGECWKHRTATFLLLGNICTRRCGYCAVPKGRPLPIDYDEPRRVAEAVAQLGLKYAVITSVDRDDDNVGAANIFANTIREIHRRTPDCKVEVLIPDFQGLEECLQIVLNARPEVLNHNIETVPRLYRTARSGARYERSVQLLENVKNFAPGTVSKSGLMVGLGETAEELVQVFRDLAAVKVDILTLGQYLRPSRNHLPVVRFYSPQEFAGLRKEALALGFRHVESAPLVRSSYHAHEQAETAGIL
jgi:lipoic acid synthetase